MVTESFDSYIKDLQDCVTAKRVLSTARIRQDAISYIKMSLHLLFENRSFEVHEDVSILPANFKKNKEG